MKKPPVETTTKQNARKVRIEKQRISRRVLINVWFKQPELHYIPSLEFTVMG